ncbi:MAG TPA: hypothetical protein VGM14_29385 [Streptosporangiaceae bacterium]
MTYCIAAGSGPDVSGGLLPAGAFAEKWTGGSAWTLLPVPDPPTFDLGGTMNAPASLAGVSCASRTRCMAVGGDEDTDAISSYASFAASSNGASWSVRRTGKVGAAIWNGKLWTSSGVSDTANPQSDISYLSCTSREFCMAVGSGESSFVSEFWNGKTWHSARIATPKRSFTDFAPADALSCATTTMCLAVGTLDAGNGGPIGPLAEAWNGRTWRVLRSPFQHNPGESLSAVSCRTLTDCLAIGAKQGSKASTLFTARWNGRDWKLINTINP